MPEEGKSHRAIRPAKPTGRVLRGWHRWLGLLAAGPALIIATTGILLNHGPGLRLDQRTVAAGWLFDWYGLSPREPMRAFRLDPEGIRPGDWVVEWGGQALYRGKSAGSPGRTVAAGRLGSEIVVAGERALVLLDADGELIEELHPSLLPGGRLLRCGERDGLFVCETEDGIYHFPQWSAAETTHGNAVRWFDSPSEPPGAVREEAELAYRGEGLPLSRVMLDLHSGRIFGTAGVILYDLAAGFFLALVGTGLFLALKKRK